MMMMIVIMMMMARTTDMTLHDNDVNHDYGYCNDRDVANDDDDDGDDQI